MSSANSDRNLLMGILAIQMDFISREALIKAMHDWALDKTRTIGDILVDNQALTTNHHRLLNQMADAHVAVHDGDPKRSLEAFNNAAETVVQGLSSIEDNELQHSIHHVPMHPRGGSSEHATITHHSVPSGPISSEWLSSRFRIVRPHAEGGLGKVSVAVDRELNREVALKEIKEWFADDETSRNRFTLEAEVTGGLEHPGVVPVYSLGYRDDGKPFYAMRFIKGDSLKVACARFHREKTNRSVSENALPFRNLLRRFVDVCNAVEYAHSRGVLHRDIKPSNVMLGKYGETLVVDWGLAKPIGRGPSHGDLDETTLQPSSGESSQGTQTGSAIGTPSFMPPEQAAGNLDELGPASDVYSLGATLYYLLTNQAPFNGNSSSEILESVIAGDFKPPLEIDPTIPRPLDSICTKAMARSTSERYPTPMDLAQDVERWLADESTSSYVEPISVRTRRWMRKHPRTMATLAASLVMGLVTTLLISVVVSDKNVQLQDKQHQITISHNAERQARQTAEEARKAAEDTNLELAKANEVIVQKSKDVQLERDNAVAFIEFIRDDFLSQASPEFEVNRDIKLREVLDNVADQVPEKYADRPLVEATIAEIFGDTYRDLGDYSVAETHLTRAHQLYVEHKGAESRHALQCANALVMLYLDRGQYDDADELGRSTFDLCTKTLERSDPITLSSMHNLSCLDRIEGRYEDSLELALETFELREQHIGIGHRDTLISMNNLGLAYSRLGNHEKSEEFHRRTLDLRRQHLAELHPDTLGSQSQLIQQLILMREYIEADQLISQTLEDMREILGPDHPHTLACEQTKAKLLSAMGDPESAVEKLRYVLELRKAGPTWN